MEGITSDKVSSRNEFGVFERQQGQWGWRWGLGVRDDSSDELEEDGARSEGPVNQGQKHTVSSPGGQ